MKDIQIDASAREATFVVPKSVYSLEALKIAAHVFDNRAVASASEAKGGYEVSLTAKRRQVSEADLRALAGEFFNELLNQEYRFLVAKFNEKISGLVVTQTLLAARGGEKPAAQPAETPEFLAQVEDMMKRAQDEIDRTMPKRIAPQGSPIPPETEDAVA